jgi:hypothetical protein
VPVATLVPATTLPILATAIPPALPTAQPVPTAMPPAPPTAQPIPTAVESPGPGWILALESDANFDGVTDRIFYRPSDYVAEMNFSDPRLASIAVAVTDVALMQSSPSGAQLLLTIDTHGGHADQPLFDFAGRREPSAYLLALDPARGPLFHLLPYGASGAGYGGPIGIHWETGANGFRVIAESNGGI